MRTWFRSKEDDSPLPARPVAIGWPTRAFVKNAADDFINRVVNGGKTDRPRADELQALVDQVAAAIDEYHATDAGRVYRHVLETGALPEPSPSAIQVERERRAAFERRFM